MPYREEGLLLQREAQSMQLQGSYTGGQPCYQEISNDVFKDKGDICANYSQMLTNSASRVQTHRWMAGKQKANVVKC
jgi:hypothetical protein